MKRSTVLEITYISLGFITVLLWIFLFTIGLLIDSSYYRSALNYGFWDLKDCTWAIISFTLSNVALLALCAGFLGGVCSKIISTEGFTLSKQELIDKKTDYVLFENPFISGFRGVIMFLVVLSMQYLSSFSDLSSISSNESQVKSQENIRESQMYISLMQDIKDSISKDKIKELWKNYEIKNKKDDADSLVNRVILLKDSIKQFAFDGTPESETKKRIFEGKIISTRRLIKVPPLVEIPGISASSYFKFAIIVSLLAFICGYDPGRFNTLISKFPIISKKESQEKKDN